MQRFIFPALFAAFACSDETAPGSPMSGPPTGTSEGAPSDENRAGAAGDMNMPGARSGVDMPGGTGGMLPEGPADLPVADGVGGEDASGGEALPRTLAEPNGFARNPIVSHVFTADPSAHVFEGRVYVYTSHDLDDQTGYEMTDYHAFSSNDLVNWQDHGVVLDAANIGWTDRLYAPGAAYSPATGKYYLYFPNAGSAIGVAVADSPGGPFADALGGPLVDRNVPGAEDVDWLFDPMAFVDDDGQAYLYFGGGPENTGDNARVIRLNADMVSLADAAATIIPAPDFFEAAHVHRHDDRYYFSYSTGFVNHPAFIDYLVSDNPVTGWQYVGTLLQQPALNNSNNNHHSIIEYEESSYIFYHNRVLANRDGFSSFQRSITLDNLTYDARGNIDLVPSQQGVVRQLRSVDAFSRIEAEAMADQRGVETAFAVQGGVPAGVSLTELESGDWVGYSQLDFGAGASTLRARVASRTGGALVVHVDGCNEFTTSPGTEVGRCDIPAPGGAETWTDVTCGVSVSAGVHDLCLSLSGDAGVPLFDLDYFVFE